MKVFQFFIFLCVLLAQSADASGQSDRGAEFLAKCETLLAGYAEPAVFSGLKDAGADPRVAAIAFEHAVAALSSSVKEGARADFELVVYYTDKSAGFGCEFIGDGGYTVASASAFGRTPRVSFAKQVARSRIAILDAEAGEDPQVRFYFDFASGSEPVARIYPTEDGEVSVPGLTVAIDADAMVRVCDHREGNLTTLAANSTKISRVIDGCENRGSGQTFEAKPPTVFEYDQNTNLIESRWSDDVGEPGRTEYRNVLNDRGDWVSRELLIQTASDDEAVSIRTERRFIRYRTAESVD